MLPENLLHRLRLARAQDAVVDEDAGELVADGLVQQRCRHAGIHAAAQAEDDLFAADLPPDFGDGLLDVIAHRPAFAAAADLVDEIGQDFLAARRVDDFGMELQAEQFLRAVLDGGERRVLGDGDRLEAARQFRELVAVRIPDLELRRQSAEERARRILDLQHALAVFAFLAFLDLAAEELREQLHAEANAEHRHAEAENGLVRQRRVLGINRRRPAGKNDAAGLERGDFGGGRVVAQDGGIDVALADAARDDLGVLRPKIQNDDLFVHEIKTERCLCL